MDIKVLRRRWFVICKQSGLDEDSRRAVQARVCGKPSAAEMTATDFLRCIQNVDQPAAKPASGGRKSKKKQAAMIHAIWADLGKIGALKSDSRASLRAFCARMIGLKDDTATIEPDFLTPAQASKVLEALKAIQRRHKSKAEAE